MMNYTFKKGIAMIELIFAIVVIGITLMSAPMLISQSIQSNLTAFQQESIAMAATHASAIMTYAWDEQNTELGGINILLVTNGDVDLNQTALDTVRGTTTPKVPADQRQRRFAGTSATALLISDGNLTTQDNLDDIDDFNTRPLTLSTYSSTLNQVNEGDYIDINISIDTNVTYGKDEANYQTGGNSFSFSKPFASSKDIPVNQTTNIKRIITTLTSNSQSAELKAKKIVLQSFMCNIGAANPIENGGY